MDSEQRTRLANYARNYMAYLGFETRGTTNYVLTPQSKKLNYNFNLPVVNMGAGFMAGPSVGWQITTGDEKKDETLTKVAQDIWDRSHGESVFAGGCLSAAIFGDMVVVSRKRESGDAFLNFVDPCSCIPEFFANDPTRLSTLSIVQGEKESKTTETWTIDSRVVEVGDDKQLLTNEAHSLGEVPAVWIPNQGIIGNSFGRGEHEQIIDLVEEFNHHSQKRSTVLDFNAAPTLVVKGVQKSDALEKNIRTVIYAPAGAEVGFLSMPELPADFQLQLDAMERSIQKISETPEIAFGKVDSGFSNATGVSLKVLYGPLIAKTNRKRRAWAPLLEKVMWLALKIEGKNVEQEQVNIIWGDSTPNNEAEMLEQMEAKLRIGISKKQALSELNYSHEDIQRMESERETENEVAGQRALKLFDSGAA